MARPWLKNIPGLANVLLRMLALTWRVQPAYVAGLILLELLQGLLPLASAWVTKVLFDLLAQGLEKGATPMLTLGLLLVAAQAGIAVARDLTGSVNTYLRADLGRALTLNVQETIYQKLNSLVGLAPFEDSRLYDTIQIGTQGAQHGAFQAFDIFTSLVRSTVTLIAFMGTLMVFSPLLAAGVSLAVIPQFYTQVRLGRQRFDLAVDNSPKERRASYYSYLLSGVYFAKEIRLFNLSDHFLRAFRRTSQEIHQAQRRHQAHALRWQVVLGVLASLVGAGAFMTVVVEAFIGRLSLGDVVLYTSAVGSVQSASSNLIYALAQINESVLFYTRFTDLLALPQSVVVTNPARPVPLLASGIELRNVSFRYGDQHPWILRHLNLLIPARHCIALVGLNGAGKTTLVKLLTRCYDPTEGQILWDGIDIRAFDPQELRRRIGAIFQDFVRYDLSVQENIGLGDVTRIGDCARVREAAIQAGIHDTITALPLGYQTILSRWLGDGPGVDLSGGEWQKIALARMFMRPADVLVLDEPTAALDVTAEYDLYRRFTELVAGRTSLLISHRLSTVRMADIVAVLENGQITEYGSHEELLTHGISYARLYHTQARQYQ